jgi:uncharacterized protein involved in response to NO
MRNVAVLSNGFRPFFLLAGLWAVIAMPLWVCAHRGLLTISPAYGDVAWHAHEMLFGYAAAVVCGFLFTAIPNWTGRLPVRGRPLLALAAVWLAGRAAMLAAPAIGLPLAAAIDLAFLACVIAVAGREIVAGRNWRNLRVLAAVGVLLAGNVLFHAAALQEAATTPALRLAVAALIVLITLVGGRITPSFTRNWLVRQRPGDALPAPFGRPDAAAIVATVAGAGAWAVAPAHPATGALAAIAAILLAVRLRRWRGHATAREPILLVLHVAYAFVPLGFAMLAASAAWPGLVPGDGVLHAWTVGAVGLMTLAVMTRASLGHTGRALSASPATAAAYATLAAAALLRIAAPVLPELYLPLLAAGGIAWTLAFGLFLWSFVPVLALPPARNRRAAA